MYVPAFYQPDEESVRELLRRHGAVDLVTASADGLRATMLPMIWVEPDGSQESGDLGLLRGHFARKNNHWQHEVIGEAMAIIRGPDAYVTPSWYETKREHGRVVPTWNYITAQVHGALTVHDDPDWVERNVRALTAKHEAARDPRWGVDDAPPTFIDGQLRAIVGVEMRISRIDAKFKLSQNRSLADVKGAIDGLEANGTLEMAAAMRAAASGREK